MIALKNATLVHLHPAEVETGMDVVIDGTEIVATGRGAASGVHTSQVVDCAGRLCMPGLVCGHAHIYSALSRGILARIAPSSDFVSVLQHLWWRLDRAIDAEILQASAKVAAVEAIMAGCTAVIDHHASPSFIAGSLDVIKKALEEAGLRGVLCYEVTDRNGPQGMEEGIAENARFVGIVEDEKGRKGKGRLTEAMIGGHAPFTIPDCGLTSLGDLVRETQRGFHVHAAEDAFDPSFSHRLYGCDPLERLEAFGLLTDKSLIAHGVHLGEGDRERLVRHDSFLAHNPRSNMNNSVGYARFIHEVKRAVLGTDGIGADMLEEMKFAYFKHRDSGGSLFPQDFARILCGGSDLLGRCFSESFGRVRKGYKADLIVVDYRPPTPLESSNVAGHAVFGMSGGQVETVIVNGRIVMENRTFSWDVLETARAAREAARKLWRRMDEMT
jgi:putative selenium metabolism protein SsnA